MTKTTKKAVSTLSEALGIATEKYTFTNPRTNDTLEVQLIPGGLIEIAEFQEMINARGSENALAEVVRQFTTLVFDRRVDQSLTIADIKSFFRTTVAEDIFANMNILLSGMVPDEKK